MGVSVGWEGRKTDYSCCQAEGWLRVVGLCTAARITVGCCCRAIVRYELVASCWM